MVATAGNGPEAVIQANRYYADVAVLDISMPIMNGIEATRQIRTGSPNTSIVILSIHDSPPYIKAALDAGATSYVLKELIANDLVDAVRAANQGKRYFSLRIAEVAGRYV